MILLLKQVSYDSPRSHALPAKEGERLVHFIMCMMSRVHAR